MASVLYFCVGGSFSLTLSPDPSVSRGKRLESLCDLWGTVPAEWCPEDTLVPHRRLCTGIASDTSSPMAGTNNPWRSHGCDRYLLEHCFAIAAGYPVSHHRLGLQHPSLRLLACDADLARDHQLRSSASMGPSLR